MIYMTYFKHYKTRTLLLSLLILLSLVVLPSVAGAAFTVPSGITSYANLSINNLQTSPVAQYTQVMIPINALQFQSVMNGGGNNIEIFNGISGANELPYTWLEGNLLNELQTTSLNTSANIILWVNLPFSIAASTDAVNALSIGFAPIGTSLMNGNNVGESGILSNSLSGSSCSKYDNGANVFVSYQSWCGLSGLPSGYAQTNGAGTVIQFGTSNTQIKAGNSNSNGIYLTSANGLSLSYNSPGYVTDIIGNFPTSGTDFLGVGSTTAGGLTNARWQFLIQASPILGFRSGTFGGGTNALSPNAMVPSLLNVYSFDYLTSTTANTYVNYSFETPTGPSTTNPLTVSTANSNTILFFSTTSTSTPIVLFTTRTRNLPPEDVQPSVSNSVVYNILTIPIISPSTSSTYDNGQTITISSFVSGGTPPYTYNFLIFNSITNVLIANQLGNSNSMSFTVNSFMVGNTYKANVLVTDSAISNGIKNSINSGIINVNNFPIFTLVPSNTLIDVGQYEHFTLKALNGVGPFNAILFNLSAWILQSNKLQQSLNVIITSGGTNTINFQLPKIATQYNVPSQFVSSSYNVIPVTVINFRASNTQNGYQYKLSFNASNYSTILSNNLQNVAFFDSNGNEINSWLAGVTNNQTQTNNLNLANNITYFLKFNTQITGFNTIAINNSISNNTNHPSCYQPDGLVADPSAVHGFEVLGGDVPPNSTVVKYVSNDPRVCGVTVQISMRDIETANNVYDYNTIDNSVSAYTANGKIVNIVFYSVGSGTDLPTWLSCPNSLPSGGLYNQPIPLYWQSCYTNFLNKFISNVTAHYQNNQSIGYFRFGIGYEDHTVPWGSSLFSNTTFINNAINNGFSNTVWLSWTTNEFNYIASLNPTHQILMNNGDGYGGQPNQDNMSVYQTVVEVNDSIGFGQESWDNGAIAAMLIGNGHQANRQILYAGKVPMWEQTSIFGSQPSFSLNAIVTTLLPINVQIIELPAYYFLTADDPSYSGYNTNGVIWNAILTEGANTIGWSNTTNSVGKIQLPLNTSKLIYMYIGPKTQNLFNGQIVGESSILSYANTGSCTQYDNGANVFIYYQSFCGLSSNSIPAGWTSSSGTIIIDGTTNVEVLNGAGTTGNYIGITSPLSTNTPSNTVDVLMNATFGNPGTLFGTTDDSLGSGLATFGTFMMVGQGGTSPKGVGGSVQGGGVTSFGHPINKPVVYSYQIWNTITGNFSANYSSFGTVVHSSTHIGTRLVLWTSNTVIPSSIYYIDSRYSPPSNFTPIFILGRPISSSSSGTSTFGLLTNSPSQQTLSYSIIATDLGTTTPYTVWNTTVSANTIILSQALDNPTLALSNTLIDQGQGTLLTATIAGGTPPYTYNFLIVNSITNTILTSMSYNGVYSTSNSWFWSPILANLGNTIAANVIVTDSASTPVTENSPYYDIGYNSINSITISALINVGVHIQTQTYNISQQGNLSIQTFASYLPLIALVIVAGVMITIILLAMQFNQIKADKF